MKTEMKHTKGKWTQDSYIIASEETHEEIAWIKALSTGSSRSAEAESNAKLIAAAPDMLEALDNFIRAIDLITSKEGRKYMESGRLKAYDSLKNSLTYKTAIEAINKATL